ncbi:hypothetical protein D4100_01330 [Serratia inhibens]|uniref:Uncharacterized protein n=1 Tax=Serratia inhibens TaxID=2338073 RepID=A0AA92X5T4_9GAMM|nr:hypothetical protein D4100_01330 [Serratia inhibens]
MGGKVTVQAVTKFDNKTTYYRWRRDINDCRFLSAIDSLYILSAEINFTLPGERPYAAAACGKLSQEA